jgi:hypothetical protein
LWQERTNERKRNKTNEKQKVGGDWEKTTDTPERQAPDGSQMGV